MKNLKLQNSEYDAIEAEREFNALRSFDHPLIPRIADIVKDTDGFVCIILHKCKCNLEEMLVQKGEISEEEILKFIAMICLPLENLH